MLEEDVCLCSVEMRLAGTVAIKQELAPPDELHTLRTLSSTSLSEMN